MDIKLEWELLNEVDYVKNKKSGSTYIVKKFNPNRHELIEPEISKDRYRELEKEKQKQRGEVGKQQLKKDYAAVQDIKKIDVPKEIGPETSDQAVGDNPKVEKKLATRMAQFGKASAQHFKAVKAVAKEVKAQNPNLADDEIAQLVKKTLKEKNITQPPEFNLCTVSVPGTNLYCSGNVEIKREDMPQLKTKAVKGTRAWEIAKKIAAEKGQAPEDVEVNAEPIFLEYLKNKGYNVVTGELMPATEMKATQNELKGDQVAGMAWSLMTDPEARKPDSDLRKPLIVSRDGYVLDGHHRWAALATYDMMKGESDVLDVPVIKVDTDIEDLVDISNTFGDEFGLKRKAATREAPAAQAPAPTPEKKSQPKSEARNESWNKKFAQFIREDSNVKFVNLPPTKLPTGGWKEEFGEYVYNNKRWKVTPASDASLRSKKYFDVVGPNGKRVKNLDPYYRENPFGGERDAVAHMIVQAKGNWPTKDIDAKDWE